MDLLHSDGGNLKWFNYLKKVCQFLQKLNMNLLCPCIYTYNPAIPLLREMKVYVHTKTCTWMFIVALFIMVYTGIHPNAYQQMKR